MPLASTGWRGTSSRTEGREGTSPVSLRASRARGGSAEGRPAGPGGLDSPRQPVSCERDPRDPSALSGPPAPGPPGRDRRRRSRGTWRRPPGLQRLPDRGRLRPGIHRPASPLEDPSPGADAVFVAVTTAGRGSVGSRRRVLASPTGERRSPRARTCHARGSHAKPSELKRARTGTGWREARALPSRRSRACPRARPGSSRESPAGRGSERAPGRCATRSA